MESTAVVMPPCAGVTPLKAPLAERVGAAVGDRESRQFAFRLTARLPKPTGASRAVSRLLVPIVSIVSTPRVEAMETKGTVAYLRSTPSAVKNGNRQRAYSIWLLRSRESFRLNDPQPTSSTLQLTTDNRPMTNSSVAFGRAPMGSFRSASFTRRRQFRLSRFGGASQLPGDLRDIHDGDKLGW